MYALRKLSSSISDLLNLQNKHGSLNDNHEEKTYPLHFYARMGNSILVEKLLKSSHLKVDTEDQKGRTPLHYAVQNSSIDVTVVLLKYGANVDANDYTEMAPAHFAVQGDQMNQILLLIKNGADFCAKDKYGKTPFDIACEYGYIKIIEILISNGILSKIYEEIKNSPCTNMSPLHLAARHGHVEICALLINRGFPLNHANSHGSALHEVVKNGRIPVARLLLNLGIDHKIVDSLGCTAGDLAEKGVDRNPISAREIIALMKDYPRRVYGTAIRNYSTDESTGHLSLTTGDIVWITDQASCERKGLWKGIVFTSKGNSRSGYFPAHCVEVDKENLSNFNRDSSMSNKLRGQTKSGGGAHPRCPTAPSSSSSLSILKTPKTPRKLKMVPMPTVPDVSKLPAAGLSTFNTMNMNGQPHHHHHHTNGITDSESTASSGGGGSSSDKHSFLLSSAAQPYYLPRRPSALNLPPNCSTSPTPSRPDSCLEGSASFTDEDDSFTMTSSPTTFPTTSALITRHSFSKKSDRNSTSSGCSQASSGFESAKTTSQLASSNSSSSCGSSNLVNHSSMSSGVSSLTDSPSNRSTGGMSLSSGTASCSSPYYYCNGDSGYDNYENGRNGLGKKFNVRELMAKGVAETEILAEWLNKLSFSQYLSLFLAQGYDLVSIARITPEDLTALGITQPEHRKRLMKDIHEWNITDYFPSYIPSNNGIRDFLLALGLPQYIEVFEAQGSHTIRDLEELTWEDLEEMGVKKLGHMKRLTLALKKLKANRATRQKSNPNLHSPDYVYINELPQPPLSARSTSSLGNVPLTFQNGYNSSGQSSVYSTLGRSSRLSIATMMPDMAKKRPIVPVLPSSRPPGQVENSDDFPVKPYCNGQKISEYGEIRKPVKLNLVTTNQILSEYSDLYEETADEMADNNCCSKASQSDRVEYNEDFPPPPAPLSCDTSFRILYNLQTSLNDIPESTAILSSDSMPFAQDNFDTIRSRDRQNFRSQPSTPRHSINFLTNPKTNAYTQNHKDKDVLNDIGHMLKNLTDELDAMLIPNSSLPSTTRR